MTRPRSASESASESKHQVLVLTDELPLLVHHYSYDLYVRVHVALVNAVGGPAFSRVPCACVRPATPHTPALFHCQLDENVNAWFDVQYYISTGVNMAHREQLCVSAHTHAPNQERHEHENAPMPTYPGLITIHEPRAIRGVFDFGSRVASTVVTWTVQEYSWAMHHTSNVYALEPDVLAQLLVHVHGLAICKKCRLDEQLTAPVVCAAQRQGKAWPNITTLEGTWSGEWRAGLHAVFPCLQAIVMRTSARTLRDWLPNLRGCTSLDSVNVPHETLRTLEHVDTLQVLTLDKHPVDTLDASVVNRTWQWVCTFPLLKVLNVHAFFLACLVATAPVPHQVRHVELLTVMDQAPPEHMRAHVTTVLHPKLETFGMRLVAFHSEDEDAATMRRRLASRVPVVGWSDIRPGALKHLRQWTSDAMGVDVPLPPFVPCAHVEVRVHCHKHMAALQDWVKRVTCPRRFMLWVLLGQYVRLGNSSWAWKADMTVSLEHLKRTVKCHTASCGLYVSFNLALSRLNHKDEPYHAHACAYMRQRRSW